MSLLAGIDYSTFCVDLVTVDETTGRATWHSYPLAGPHAFERTRSVADALPGRASAFWDDVLALAIEEPQGAQKQTVAKLKAVQGAILSCLPARLLVAPLEPNRWRKLVGLAGNASKDEVADYSRMRSGSLWVEEPFDNATWTQDAHDAHCLALALRQLVESDGQTALALA